MSGTSLTLHVANNDDLNKQIREMVRGYMAGEARTEIVAVFEAAVRQKLESSAEGSIKNAIDSHFRANAGYGRDPKRAESEFSGMVEKWLRESARDLFVEYLSTDVGSRLRQLVRDEIKVAVDDKIRFEIKESVRGALVQLLGFKQT